MVLLLVVVVVGHLVVVVVANQKKQILRPWWVRLVGVVGVEAVARVVQRDKG